MTHSNLSAYAKTDRPVHALISSYACRPNAGSELGTGWNWVVHLAEAGCHLDVFTAARNREETEKYLAEHAMPGVRFHFVEVPWLSPWASGARHYLLWQWRTWRQALALNKTGQFDVALHVSYGSVHVPTQLWRLGLPTLFGPVGGGQTAPESLLGYFGGAAKAERRRTFLTKLLPKLPVYRHSLRKMRVVLGANSETMALAKSAGCKDVRLLCDTGLRADYAAEGPRRFEACRGTRLIWVGRFAPRKGLALALDALRDAADTITLTLVGDGLPMEVVRGMLKERGLEQRVSWSGGRMDWMEVREQFRAHDALLFTSLRDSFGSQLLEAMSQGTPVVALSMSGARDFLPNHGCVKVEAGADATETVKRLTAAINEFAATSAEERDRMSAVVWRAAQNFAWTRRAATMKGIFDEVLGRSTT